MTDASANELRDLIQTMKTRVRGIPFRTVIEVLSGHAVLPFDRADPTNQGVLTSLEDAAADAGSKVNVNGIVRERPNEVGNDIEPFVKDALNARGLGAQIPATKAGQKKSSGYPDIVFHDERKRTFYLECKTYSLKTVDSSQRSFYVSPSESFKVTADGFHLAIAFEVHAASGDGARKVYKVRQWKLVSLEDLLVDVKYEFNANNQALYAGSAIMRQGPL